MGAPDYAAYIPSVVFKDDVGGAGGTDLIAVNYNGLRDDLGTYVQNHIEGVNNHHASNDVLDYYADNVPTVRLNLLETTAYANAAPDAQHLYTQWQRNDMFAKIDKDIIGGPASTLTQRLIDYFTTLTAGNGSLTTIWGLLHGGSPTFGSIIAVANDNTHAAVQALAPSGDPASGYLARWSNHAGTVDHAQIDYSGLGIFYGGVAGIAPDTTNPAGRFLSIDNVARKAISLRYNNNTENGYLSSDGSANLSTGTFTGAVVMQSTLTVTGHVTWDSYVQSVASVDPGTGSAGNGYIWFDSVAGIYKARQGAGAAVALIGAAAAVGVVGGIQYSTGSGIFGADASNLFYDATNHFLAVGRGGVAPTHTIEAGGTIVSYGGNAGLAAFSRQTNGSAYAEWSRLDASVLLSTDQGSLWTIDPASGVMTPFAWITATAVNAWSNAAGHPTFAYKKDVTGSVRLRGGLLGTSATNAIIYTLPAGYVPTATHAFACSYFNGASWSTCTVYVNNSGQVTTTIGNGVAGAIVSVNDIEFDTLA